MAKWHNYKISIVWTCDITGFQIEYHDYINKFCDINGIPQYKTSIFKPILIFAVEVYRSL